MTALRRTLAFTSMILCGMRASGSPDYWKNSNLGLLAPVLDRLGSTRFSDVRSAFLNLIWEMAPDGRKKGVYSSRGAYPCPLCGQGGSLEHIVLRCPGLAQQRRELCEAAARSYAYGVAPPEPPPPGLYGTGQAVPPELFDHSLQPAA
jgi:hypothetical protein